MQWYDAKLTSASYIADYRLHIRYGDKLEADIDLRDLLDHPFYAPLKDKKLFAQVRVDDEVPILVWPNNIDLSPEILYERAIKNSKAAPAS